MRVSLVEPRAPFYNFYSSVIKRLPMIGPIYLGTILKNDGHDVAIYNENMRHLDLSEIKDSDVLGISIMTATAPRGYEIAETMRSLNPKCRIIFGGCHATFMPEEALRYGDHVVTGEAELVISDLVRYGGERIAQGIPVSNLDELPFPDFSLMRVGRRPGITTVSTSRGCPNECTFCSVSPMFGRKYRFRSAESVLQELSRFKHKHVFFCDDNFGVNRKVTKELLEIMIETKVTPGWTAETSVKISEDEDMLKMMARAGCRRLCIGFESMNAETLKSYGKKQTPEDIKNCIRVLHKNGIKVHGMFISEGYSDIYDKLGLDTLQLTILTPIIGSKLYRKVKDAGRFVTHIYPRDWKLFDGGHVVHSPDNMSPLEMQKQTVKSLGRFYSRVNAAKMLIKGRFDDFLIRHIGRQTLRKWEKQNKGYLTRLKQDLAADEVSSQRRAA
ncbi:MAG: hypothetical protein A2Y91_06685 [Chloroflexi bacterium RBG_13_54_8]|nr:MAG: hypothetical protein A2Y91_06685 [Chloroflexi bacterium RBG_13_54_8]